MTAIIYLVIAVLCAVLTLVSYVERLYTESGKFLSREFQENIEAFEKLVEPKLASTSRRIEVNFRSSVISLRKHRHPLPVREHLWPTRPRERFRHSTWRAPRR